MTITKNSDIVNAAVARMNERLEDLGAFDGKNLGAGISWPTVVSPLRDPLVILGELRLRIGDGQLPLGMTEEEIRNPYIDGETRAHIQAALVEREQLRLIDELHAAINRELQLVKVLAKASFGQQLKESLLDICREFDAIDLSECNRRLEAGEKFDAACDETMERRQALGEQIKERLGEYFASFEMEHEKVSRRRPDPAPATQALKLMILRAAREIYDEFNPDGPSGIMVAQDTVHRLAVLLS